MIVISLHRRLSRRYLQILPLHLKCRLLPTNPRQASLRKLSVRSPQVFNSRLGYPATCFYAQLRWITLGPSVSPRLLARSLPGLCYIVLSLSSYITDPFRMSPSWITRSYWIKRLFIVQNSSLLPLKFGRSFMPAAAERALTPAKHRWLGRPLPLPTT